MNKFMLVAVLAVASCGVFAEGEDPYADYVKLSANDDSSHYSFSTAGYWNDHLAPHSDTNYYVAADKTLWMSAVMSTSAAAQYTNCWHGGQLVLAGKFRAFVGAGNQYSPCVPDLVLLGGSEIQYSTYGFFAKQDGTSTVVTVQSTYDNPATISQHYANSAFSSGGYRGCYCSTPFLGDSDAHLVLTRPFVNYSGAKIDHGFYFEMNKGCFSDYQGTLTILGSNTIVTTSGGAMNTPDCAVRLVDAPEVTLGPNNDDAVSAAARMRSFSAPSGNLKFFYRPTSKKIVPRLDVTEALTLGSDLKMKLSNYERAGMVGMPEGGTYGTLARVAALGTDTTTELSDDVKLDIPANLPPYYKPYLRVVTNDTSRFVDVVVDKLVTMTVGNIETTRGADIEYGSFAPGHGDTFSNKEEPTADKDYHYYMSAKLCCFKSIEMPLATLTYAGGNSWKGGSTIHFKEIGMYTGNEMGMWSTDTHRYVIAEKFHVIPSGTANTYAGYWFNGSHNLRIMADLYGPGDVAFRFFTQAAVGTLNLCNDNSNYHGQLIFAQLPKSGTCPPYKLQVYVSDGRNWGGDYTGTSAYDAIFLNNFPQINVTNNVTLAQQNRGLLIRGGAKLNVSANKTMRLANQVTYAGLTTKSGTGTLDLAGTARFIDGNEETAPLAETNVLAVAEGALKISSKEAADGLAISFAAGTSLVIPSDSTDGLYDVKWDAPLTVAGAVLPVTIEIAAADVEKDSLSVPICTVNETAGGDLETSLFRVARTTNHMKCVSVTKSSADGKVVFTANLERQGVLLIVR